MSLPRPIISWFKPTPDSSTLTFNTSESILGQCTLSSAAPGGNLDFTVLAELSVASGTSTIRLRKDSIAGTIIASVAITTVSTVTSVTAALTDPTTTTLLFITGQTSTGTSTLRFLDLVAQGESTDPVFNLVSGTAYTELSPWVNGTMFRDDNDRVWSLDTDEETAYSRGQLRRVFPQMSGTGHIGSKQIKPWAVLVGTDVWVFSLYSNPANMNPGTFDSSHYEVSVHDGLDLNIKYTTISTPATGIRNYAAVYDGVQYIWFFYVVDAASTQIVAHRWDTRSISSGPTITNYRSVANAQFQTIDAALLPHGKIAVVASSYNFTTNNVIIDHSYLDPTTGIVLSSPAPVTTTIPLFSVNSVMCGGGVGIFENQTDSATNWRYAVWHSDPATDTQVFLTMKTINGTTLAVSASTTLLTITPSGVTGNLCFGQVTGFYDNVDGSVYYWGQLNESPSITTINSAPYDQTIFNAKVGQSATTIRSSWLASKPFFIHGAWYVLTGYDDGQDLAAQRSLHIRANGALNVIAQIGYSEMSAAYFLGESSRIVPNEVVSSRTIPFVTPVVRVPAGKLVAAVMTGGETRGGNQTKLLSMDFDAVYSRGAVAPGDMIVYPGGVPQVVGPRDASHDLSPLLQPNLATVAGLGTGNVLGTFLTAYSYAYTDASGRVYESGLSPQNSHIFLDAGTRTLTFKTLKHYGLGNAKIRFYTSIADGATLHIQGETQNLTTSDTVTVTVSPQAFTNTTGQHYATGGGLINFPPPACRLVSSWKDRVILAGTNIDGEIWVSQESGEGIGIGLNPLLRSQWGSADGPIGGMGPVDFNYFALLRRSGCAVIDGPGPDGGASGNFIIKTLNTRRGCFRPMSVVDGPGGCYFQNFADNRMCAVTPGLQVVTLSQGIEDHVLARVVTSAFHNGSTREVWFFTDNGDIYALDYEHPTQEHPLGQWYRWTGAGLSDSYGVGAIEDDTGTIFWLQSNKAMRFIRTTGDLFEDVDSAFVDQNILMKLKTGKMAPLGFGGEFFGYRLKFLGQHQGASTLRVAITNGDATTENHDVSTTSPTDYQVLPGNLVRTQEMEVSIEETASTTEGYVYDGLEVEFQPTGRGKDNNTTHKI